MKTTPMQEVYENFNKMSDADFKAWLLNTDLLKKEKSIIIDFAYKCRNIMAADKYSITKWYNEIFSTKEQ